MILRLGKHEHFIGVVVDYGNDTVLWKDSKVGFIRDYDLKPGLDQLRREIF